MHFDGIDSVEMQVNSVPSLRLTRAWEATRWGSQGTRLSPQGL